MLPLIIRIVFIMLQNPYVNLSREILKNKLTPYSIYSRAVIASIPACPELRSAGSQNYLSDLGVRFRNDPRILLEEYCKMNSLDISLYDQSLGRPEDFFAKWTRSGLSTLDLSAHVDVLVNFAGRWDFVSELGKIFWENNLACSDYLILTYFASAIGNHEKLNKIPDQMYLRLLENEKLSPDKIVVTYIRYCSRLIKRLGELNKAEEYLENAKSFISHSICEFNISQDDGLVLRAACDNLKSLIYLKRDDFDKSFSILSEANLSINNLGDNLIAVGLDPAKRIREQISGNLFQLYLLKNNFAEAELLAKCNLEWVKKNHISSQSEAEVLVGYVYYLQERWKESIDYFERASEVCKNFGFVSQLDLIRKFLCVAYSKTGNENGYNLVREEMKNDPAGIKS